MKNILSFDIGGTEIKYCIINEKYDILKENIVNTPKQENNNTMKTIHEIIEENLGEQLIGVSFSLPCAINENDEFEIIGAVTELAGINLKKEIEEKYNMPCHIENDANCAAIAEAKKGKGQGVSNSVTFTVGTGIGGGIIINDKLYKGSKNCAGEIGLIPMKAAKEKFDLEDNIFSNLGSARSLVYHAKKSWLDVENAKDVFDLAKKDNEVAQHCVNIFIENISNGIITIISILAPEKIIIGGGVTNNPIFINKIRDKMDNLYPIWRNLTEIDVAKFGNKAGMIGAAIIWFEEENYEK